MGDENPIRTLGDYSKPSHKGYRNTIELPVGNNVVPLRSDTIRLVQNGCSFHGLRSEDPNQHLKDFLKLVDSLDLDGENKERTRLRLFQFSLRDQASNWLERLPAGSITTWEDLTTRLLAQFFPPRRTAKLCNDILIRTIDQSAGGKLRDRNAEESWTLLEDLALYDNGSWNDPRDFAKPVKAIALPQDVPSTSDRRLIELENQVQRLMEAHLAPTQPTQVNKVTTLCEQDDMIGKINLLWKTFSKKLNDAPIPESAGNSMAYENIASIIHIEREELRRKGIKSPSKLFSSKYLSPASIIELKKNPSAPKRVHFVNSIVILSKESEAEEGETTTGITPEHGHGITKEVKEEVKEVIDEEESKVETDEEVEEILEDEEEEEEDEDGENFNSFPTMEELTHHEWLLKNPRPPWVKARIRAGSLNNIKISCMIGYFFKRHAYIDLESPINIMFRRQYNQIMTYGLRSRQKPSNLNKISNFVGRVRSLKFLIGSFAYECDFMILEDTTSIIDRHLGEMAFGRPFIDETGLVYNREEETVMFKQDDEKITFKMPHTMEIFKQTRLMGLSTDSIPPSAYEENFGHGRTHYYQSLLIGDEYMQDGGDSGFARFNTIITSLKALDEGFSSKNYVMKFLRALHPKWRAKVMVIEELKDLSSLALDELIGNLKVHEVVMEKDSEIYRGKKDRVKSIALKAKKESSDDKTLTSGSDDEEYAMAVRNFKKLFRRKGKFVRQPREEKKSFRQRDEKKGKSDRKCFRYGDPNHLIGDCPKPSRNKDQKAFIGGPWSDSENDAEDKTNNETCLMA
ncbi:MAK10-like protein [Tanacetum coccineum]|uniref:MAK10-like protein n=1 Tax=Tanacetum coccineum TaxID=301880 RepID=A0ABQ5AAY3_9ASTR